MIAPKIFTARESSAVTDFFDYHELKYTVRGVDSSEYVTELVIKPDISNSYEKFIHLQDDLEINLETQVDIYLSKVDHLLHIKVYKLQKKNRNTHEIKLDQVIAKVKSYLSYIEKHHFFSLNKDIHVPQNGEEPFEVNIQTGGNRHHIKARRYQNSFSHGPLLFSLAALGSKSAMAYGNPGTGKSELAKLMGLWMGHPLKYLSDGIVSGVSDAGESLFGNVDLIKYRKHIFDIHPTKFARSKYKFIDEISRFSGYSQALFLELLNDRKIEYQGRTLSVPDNGPVYFAANALNAGETFGIIDALSSRIDIFTFHTIYERRFAQLRKTAPLSRFPDELIITDDERKVFSDAADQLYDPLTEMIIGDLLDSYMSLPASFMEVIPNKSHLYQNVDLEHALSIIAENNENAVNALSEPSLYSSGLTSWRELNSFKWFAKALALLTTPENNIHRKTKLLRPEHIRAIFPYILLGTVKHTEVFTEKKGELLSSNPFVISQEIANDIWQATEIDSNPIEYYLPPKKEREQMSYRNRYKIEDLDHVTQSFKSHNELMRYLLTEPAPVPLKIKIIINTIEDNKKDAAMQQYIDSWVAALDYYSHFL